MGAWSESLQTPRTSPRRRPHLRPQVTCDWSDRLVHQQQVQVSTDVLCSGVLLLYVIIPTIPLILLILVASGTCCFQLLRRR